MRIEQLHIRNIASIAEADIDFIKDLQDEQGLPSPLFLIAGETGTGKTILLDANNATRTLTARQERQ